MIMPKPKCNSCGKFTASSDCPRCPTCEKSMSRLSPKNPNNSDLDIGQEIRSFRNEVNAMRAEIRELRQESADFRASVSSCFERLDTMENRVSAIEQRFEDRQLGTSDRLEATIAELKSQLNERDQELLLNDVVISGVPETRGENVVHIVNLIAQKLGTPIDERDIVVAERVGPLNPNRIEGDSAPARPRSIVVRLTRRAARTHLLSAARVRRNLSTTDIGAGGGSGGGAQVPPRKVYINERLMRSNAKLFHSAREAGKRLQFKYVWTKEGRIFVKKEDGSHVQRVRSDKDIDKIFGNVSI